MRNKLKQSGVSGIQIIKGILFGILVLESFFTGILYAEDPESGKTSEKQRDTTTENQQDVNSQSKSYDFYSVNQYKSIDDELNQRKDDESGVDQLFLFREAEKKNVAVSVKEEEKIYKNKVSEKKVKILLNNNSEVTGITPFYGEHIEIVIESNGVEYTKEVEPDKVKSIEFSDWVLMGKFPVTGNDGYAREKYYFVPSRAKILSSDNTVYEGKINPFDFFSFTIINSNGTGNYSTFFYDVWEPDPDFIKTVPAENTDNKGNKNEKKGADNKSITPVKNKSADSKTTDKSKKVSSDQKLEKELDASKYKWKILKTSDKVYNLKNLPGGVVKKFEVISDLSR